jgi:hypothetical protein
LELRNERYPEIYSPHFNMMNVIYSRLLKIEDEIEEEESQD